MQSITIIGRRWFDRVNGNTYFSSIGLVDGKQVVLISFEYGYGNQFESETFKAMQEKGIITDAEKWANGSSEQFWNYCERKEIEKFVTVTDVKRKKDLVF